jgi:hypothetical protein
MAVPVSRPPQAAGFFLFRRHGDRGRLTGTPMHAALHAASARYFFVNGFRRSINNAR